MLNNHHDVAMKLLGSEYQSLDDPAKKVARHVADRKHISRNPNTENADSKSFGERAADNVASFGGSWTFIGVFALTLTAWVILNSVILATYHKDFDPYPYILLNLFLSMLASIQAPLILMSQNRQSEKDRRNAEHDYEVNLKAEMEIMMLHQKIDLLREVQWRELIEIQREQLRLLSHLIDKHGHTNPTDGSPPGTKT